MSGPSPENVQVESGTVLRRALRDAVEDDLLKTNPADGVKPPRVTRAKITTWTPAETRYALAELEEPLRAMVHVTGQPFSTNRFTRSFQAEARRLELPPIGAHGLRHSLATTALADGVSPKIDSERLGHASIATTLDRYSHVSEEQDRAVAEALALRIAGE